MTFEIKKLENGNLQLENKYYKIEIYRFENMIGAHIKPKEVLVTLVVVNNMFCIKLHDIGCSIITVESLEGLIPSLIVAKEACKELNRLIEDNILDKYNVTNIQMF